MALSFSRSASNSSRLQAAGGPPWVSWWTLVEIAAEAYWNGMSRIASPPSLILPPVVDRLGEDLRVVQLVQRDVQGVALGDVDRVRVVPEPGRIGLVVPLALASSLAILRGRSGRLSTGLVHVLIPRIAVLALIERAWDVSRL